MSPKTTALAVLALLAVSSIVNTHVAAQAPAKIGFCRTSAYTVDCETTKRIKLIMFKLCGVGVVRAVGKYVPSKNGCACSVVQKVDSSDAWDAFQACQETKGAKDFKALQDTRCKPGQSKGPC